jgi:hypothetical protein
MDPVTKAWIIQCALRIGAVLLTIAATVHELYSKKP